MTHVLTPKALTTGAIAEIAGVAPRTVSKWIDAGILKGYRIPLSQDRRVEVAELRKFLSKHGMNVARLDEYMKGAK